jgi:hypothetical protein
MKKVLLLFLAFSSIGFAQATTQPTTRPLPEIVGYQWFIPGTKKVAGVVLIQIFDAKSSEGALKAIEKALSLYHPEKRVPKKARSKAPTSMPSTQPAAPAVNKSKSSY